MATTDPSLSNLAQSTLAIYERQAHSFDQLRSRDGREQAWIDRWLGLLPPASTLLDLGCGSGDPLAASLLARGHQVTGVDGAAAMLAIARDRYPTGHWLQADMRTMKLDTRFDGILAWNSSFHLDPDDQRALIPRLATHLAPGGAILMTVGPQAGEVMGTVGDESVYHASLAPETYRELLAAHHITVVAFVPEDPNCHGHSVLLAQHQPKQLLQT